jgi:hypothetical protein
MDSPLVSQHNPALQRTLPLCLNDMPTALPTSLSPQRRYGSAAELQRWATMGGRVYSATLLGHMFCYLGEGDHLIPGVAPHVVIQGSTTPVDDHSDGFTVLFHGSDDIFQIRNFHSLDSNELGFLTHKSPFVSAGSPNRALQSDATFGLK